jgi:hypothetical protein
MKGSWHVGKHVLSVKRNVERVKKNPVGVRRNSTWVKKNFARVEKKTATDVNGTGHFREERPTAFAVFPPMAVSCNG